MFGWVVVFLLIALIAFGLGFFALAGLAATIAKVLFVVALAMLVLGFVVRALRGEPAA